MTHHILSIMKGKEKKTLCLMLLATLLPCHGISQDVLSPRAKTMLSETAPTRAESTGTVRGAVTAYVMKTDGTLSTVHATASELLSLSREDGIKYIHLTARPQQFLDLSRQETGAERVYRGENLSQTYTGKGVVVGIVDAGFDYTHSAFRNTDGTLRISRIWEQATESFEGCSAPQRFGYGIELTKPEDMIRSLADATVNSHGTHVAAIAAGSDTFMEGAWRGTAPEAEIVLVGINQSSCTHADITNAIQYIFDYATEVGKPCVVNLSLGNHDGPHDGTSAFDRMADEMQGPGRIIVGAAGNHRADKFHISHSFSSAEDAPLRTFLGHKVKPTAASYGGEFQIWAEKEVEVTLSAYSTFNKKDVVSVTLQKDGGVQTVKLGTYATGTLTASCEVNPLNGKRHYFVTSELTSVRNNYAIAVTVKPEEAGKVDIWTDNAWFSLTSNDIEGFTAPSTESTIAEIGGTGRRIATVGAYVTRNEYTSTSLSGKLEETIGETGSFSSCGPTADGRVKPEITAPGCFIISALSAYDASGQKYTAYTSEANSRENEYGYMQGTSMASPFVAGVVATWLQANPLLTPEEVKEILTATARHDEYTGGLAEGPDNEWGYGKIDAYTGLVRCIETAGVSSPTTRGETMCDINVADNIVSMIFLTNTPKAHITISSATGAIYHNISLTDLPQGARHQMSLETLQEGVYIVSVRTSHGVKNLKMVKRH